MSRQSFQNSVLFKLIKIKKRDVRVSRKWYKKIHWITIDLFYSRFQWPIAQVCEWKNWLFIEIALLDGSRSRESFEVESRPARLWRLSKLQRFSSTFILRFGKVSPANDMEITYFSQYLRRHFENFVRKDYWIKECTRK